MGCFTSVNQVAQNEPVRRPPNQQTQEDSLQQQPQKQVVPKKEKKERLEQIEPEDQNPNQAEQVVIQPQPPPKPIVLTPEQMRKKKIAELKKLGKKANKEKKYLDANPEIENIFDLIQRRELNVDILQDTAFKQAIKYTKLLLTRNNYDQTVIESLLITDQFDLFIEALRQVDIDDQENQLIDFQVFLIIGNLILQKLSNDKHLEIKLKFIEDLKNTPQVKPFLQASQQHDPIDIASKLNFKDVKIIKYYSKICKLFRSFQLDCKYGQNEQFLYTKSRLYWTIPKLPKKNIYDDFDDVIELSEEQEMQFQDNKLNDKLILKYVDLNIFHQIALLKRWDIILEKLDKNFYKTNKMGISPFKIALKSAPFKIINQILQQTQHIIVIDSHRYTILHALAENKDQDKEELAQILIHLKSQEYQRLLTVQYVQQIPLVYYLDVCKKPLKEYVDFLSEELKTEFNPNITYEGIQLTDKYFESFEKLKRDRLQNPSSENRKVNVKSLFNQYKGTLNSSQLDEYKDFYTINVQLAKVLIKRNLDINFKWLNWFSYSQYVPYQRAQTFLLQLMIRQGLTDFAAQLIGNLNISQIEQDDLNKQAYDFFMLVQCLGEMAQYPNQKLETLLVEKIKQNLTQQLLYTPLQQKTIFNQLHIIGRQDILEEIVSQPLTNIPEEHLKIVISNILDSTDAVFARYNNKQLDQIYARQNVYIGIQLRKTKLKSINLNEIIISFKESNKETIQIPFKLGISYCRYKNISYFFKSFIKGEIAPYMDYNLHPFGKNLALLFQYKDLIFKIFSQYFEFSQLILYELWNNPQPYELELLEVLRKHPIYLSPFISNDDQAVRLFEWITRGIIVQNVRFHKFKPQHPKAIAITKINTDDFGKIIIKDDIFYEDLKNYYKHHDIKQLTLEKAREYLILSASSSAVKNMEFILESSKQIELSEIFDFHLLLQQLTLHHTRIQTIVLQQLTIHHTKIQTIESSHKSIQQLFRKIILTQQQIDGLNIAISNLHSVFKKLSPIQGLLLDKSANKGDQEQNEQEGLDQEVNQDIRFLIIAYRFLTPKVLDDFGEKLLINLFKLESQSVDVILKDCTQEKVTYLLNIIFKNNIVIDQYKVQDLLLNKFAFLQTFEYYIDKKTDQEVIQECLQKHYFRFLLTNPNKAIQYIHKVTLKWDQLSFIYQRSLIDLNFTVLYNLLYYTFDKKGRLDSKIIFGNRKQKLNKQFLLATNKHFILVLGPKYITEMLQTVQFSQANINQCAKIALENGMFENYKLLKHNLSQNELTQYLITLATKTIFDQFKVSIKQLREFAGNEAEEPEGDDQREGEGEGEEPEFHGEEEPNNEKKKQDDLFYTVRQLSQIYQNNPQFANQDYMTTIKQSITTVKPQKTSSSDNLQYMAAILIPSNQSLSLKVSYHKLIIYLLRRYFNHPLVQQNLKGYLQVLKANFKGGISEDILQNIMEFLNFYLVKYHQSVNFYWDYLLAVKTKQPNEIANFMILSKDQKPEVVQFIKANLNKYQHEFLNDYTAYLVKQGVQFKLEYQILTPCIQKQRDRINQYFECKLEDTLTFEQFAVYKGRLDHLKKPVYSAENLYLAILSKKIQTIIDIIDASGKGKQLALDNNLFYYLIQYLDEASLLKFWKKYIADTKLQNLDIFYRNGIPVMFHIIHNHMVNLYVEIFFRYLPKIKDLKFAESELVSQLLNNSFYNPEKETNIQYAVQTGFYYALEHSQFDYDLLKQIKTPKFMLPGDKIKYYQTYQKEFPKVAIAYELFQRLQKYAVENMFSVVRLGKQKVKKIDKQAEKKEEKQSPIGNKKIKRKEDLKKKKSKTPKETIVETEVEVYKKASIIDENVKLEKACLAYSFGIQHQESFQSLTIQMLLNSKDYEQQLIKIKFNPHFTSIFLSLQGFDVDLEQNILQDIQFIRKVNAPQKVANTRELFIFLINGCYGTSNQHNPIYDAILKVDAEVFLEFPNLLLTNLQVLTYVSVVRYKSDKLINFIEKHKLQINDDEKEEQIDSKINLMYLINQILNNTFLEKFEPKAQQCSRILQIINSYQLKTIKSAPTKEFLNHLEQNYSYNIINKQALQIDADLLISSLQTIIYFDLINQLINDLLHQCELGKKFQVEIIINGKEDISLDDSKLQVPITQQDDKLFIKQETFQKFYNFLEDKNYNTIIQPALLEQLPDIHMEYPGYQLDSLFSIDYHEIPKEQRSDLKNFIFFKEYLVQPMEIGVYKIDDVFAPHNHEAVRPPEIGLTHQQSSVIQSSVIQSSTLQRQVSTVQNQQQNLKDEFQFMFELLPDNTYQVRQRKGQQAELIFTEFYHFVKPHIVVELVNQQLSPTTHVISQLIQDLYKYNEYIKSLIEQEKMKDWVIQVPYQNKQIVPELFAPWAIQNLMLKMNDFIERVKNLINKEEDSSRITWRINIVSFLEVLVSRLIDIKGGKGSVFSFVDKLLDWDTLIMVLHQILYSNLAKAQQVIKVIRGIYIEFNESEVQTDYCGKGLDSIFVFGGTNYLLYNHMLVIRLNVGIIQQQVQNNQTTQEDYIFSVVNKFDFYIQIFTPDQLVQFLFNKLTIDRRMLTLSNELSFQLRKNLTISVDHTSLARIYFDEIQKARKLSVKERVKNLERIWYILTSLNKYFEQDLQKYLSDQFTNEKFEEAFQLRFYAILNALRLGVKLRDIYSTNTRKILKISAQPCEQVGRFFIKTKTSMSLMFGFQLIKSYYINNNKLGDVTTICYVKNLKQWTTTAQLIHNQRSGQLLYKLVDPNTELLTQQYILSKQAQYYNIKASTESFLVLEVENIQSVIVYSAIWPQDNQFNQSIVNTFVVDSKNSLQIINEPLFTKSLAAFSCETDEQTRQSMLDELFGEGQIDQYSDITLSQMNPIFPDQINFEFSSVHQMKRQTSYINQNSIQVDIDGEKFKIQPFQGLRANLACHFDMSKVFQQNLSQFIEDTQSLGDLPEFIMQFDNKFDENPQTIVEIVNNNQSALLNFAAALREFLENQSYPKIQNSLQYMLGVNLKSLKKDYTKQLIDQIVFIYTPDDQQELIKLENKILHVYSVIKTSNQYNGEVKMAGKGEYVQFLNQTIIKLTQQHLVVPQNSQIIVSDQYSYHDQQNIANLILLVNPIHRMLQLFQQTEVSYQIISSDEAKNKLKNITNFYYFENNTIWFIFNNFNDFLFDQLFLDYLNQNKVGQSSLKYVGPLISNGSDLVGDKIFQNLKQFQQDFYPQSNKNQIMILQEGQPRQYYETNQTLVFNPQKIAYLLTVFENEEGKQCYTQINIVLGQEYDPWVQNYTKQKSNIFSLEQTSYILIHEQNKNKLLDSHFAPSTKYKNKKIKFTQLLSKGPDPKVDYKYITDTVVLLTVKSNQSVKIEMEDKMVFSQVGFDLTNKANIEYISQNSQDLSKTQHVLIILLDDKEQTMKTKVPTSGEKQKFEIGDGDPKLITIMIKDLNKVNEESLYHKNFEGVEWNQDLVIGNTINMISVEEQKAATRTKQKRQDVLIFKDGLGNQVDKFEFKQVVLVHSLFAQIQYSPQLALIKHKDLDALSLTWTPLFKGIYKLFIDDVKIDGVFVVLANEPELEFSKLEINKGQEDIPFFEPVQFTYILRDAMQNCYGQIEDQCYKGEVVLRIGVSNDKCQVRPTFSAINQQGQSNGSFFFETLSQESSEHINTAISFFIGDKVLEKRDIKIQGISFEKRKAKFTQELEKDYKSQSYNLNIRRMNFLEDLLPLAEKKMNFSFSIKFQDEPGIDAGGLKREFYDMIGSTLKDDTYKFFQPTVQNLQKYFLHPQFNKHKEKQKYATLFGKLIANSIAQQYVIGIDIVGVFWKCVYGDPIVFQDLQQIVDTQTYSNYEMLTRLSPEELQVLDMDFTIQDGKQTIDLVSKGSQKVVTQENLESYLTLVADYYIRKKYELIYDAFTKGFASVVNLQIFQKWLRPQELSILTQGLLEIKPDNVLAKTQFSGGSNIHKQFWQKYVSESDSKTLRNMLKFITGSSSFPFDQSSYILQVQFQKHLDIRKLPLSHTCFKSIEVPLYSSYIQLKQKLDIAFTVGLEGFGFG